ncbi:MAG: hypothetical protein ACK4MS_10500 [Paracoccaceae bacterium]
MTRRASTFTQADITRAIKAAKAAGLDVNRCEIGPDGRIVLSAESAAPAADPFDAWKAKRGNHAQRLA